MSSLRSECTPISFVVLAFNTVFPGCISCTRSVLTYILHTDHSFSASGVFIAALFIHCNFQLTSWYAFPLR